MKKLILAVVAFGFSETTFAVYQGLYIGSEGRRIVFSHHPDDGMVVYSLNISDSTGRPMTKNGILYQSRNTKKPVARNDYTFGQTSPYYDDDAKSGCLISAKWEQGGVLKLSADNSCSKTEKTVYTGRYTFTDKIVFPEKYRGAWAANCRNNDPAEWLRIGKNSFTQFTDFTPATVISTNKTDGMLVAAAVEISEGASSRSFLMLRPEGSKLKVTGEHHGDRIDMTVQKCSAKAGL